MKVRAPAQASHIALFIFHCGLCCRPHLHEQFLQVSVLNLCLFLSLATISRVKK
uniref:Uncharacterized protein n=1 Tax=Arundo donax TaxID=35708 RepID=A0A0A9CUJ0_ARUDO